ncbi:hypothetical protein EPR50_G00130000 [Perca flavescens]|uniref:RING-type domain-containing protein n=1 Tax=Perca flavescens TaxID=8167 RepID=A0A484CRF7_PERFV|nr:hypothetical protein EPR50_G00130000 [Perca flavescens]
MSACVVNLEAQVESVLGALVKAATVELTKLFESRYRASALDVDVGRTEDKKQNETLDSLTTEDTTRSIGVQVDEDIYLPFELSGLSDGDCLRDCREEDKEVEVEGCLIPSEILLSEHNGQVDPEWSPLKEQVVAKTVDMVELSGIEAESPTQTKVVLHVSAEKLRHGPKQSSPAKQKLIVIQPDTCDIVSGEKVKFVCPLILKPESPAPKTDSSEKPVQTEPQQVCVSTAKGTAYSPSPSDGAVTPAQVGVWERIRTPKETANNLHMKLKLTSPEQKLMSPCVVQLVDVLTVPESAMKLQDAVVKGHDANCKTGWPLPKDLRRHQGLHTGHRLCCFTPCENGVWRLQKVVTHSRDGYPCSICGKTPRPTRKYKYKLSSAFTLSVVCTGDKTSNTKGINFSFKEEGSRMEDTQKTKLEELLMCPVCQDIFKDPRQLPCGHSMCMGCLENMMGHSSDIPFRCPDCRAHFGPIVGVQKSYALANIVEDLRVNRRRREEQTKSVYCDCCLENKTLAMKTCLKCEVSLCKEHIKDHLELPVYTGHPLVRPLSDLLERKCPEHEDEVLRYYCNASRRYICNVCAVESKQHNLATEASSVLRRQLTEYMDQRFNMLKEQSSESVKKLQEDIQREKQKVNPADSSLNSVTVVLLCLWFIVLYYAYNYSVENQMLTEALDKQQNRVHHIYSTIAELLVDHPMKSHRLPETEDQE